jgi:hypothetical protein
MLARSGLCAPRVLVLLAPLALAACGGGDVVPPSVHDAAPPELAPTCAVRFSPVPELTGATNSAAFDWGAATGCDVTVGEGGIPVVFSDAIVDKAEVDHPGGWQDGRILVHTGQARLYHILLHEVGHALGGLHVETDGALSGQKGYRNVIDAASLASVCAVLACPLFAPEE